MASKLDKLNLTQDELGRFQKAMADPKFRSLLQEYTDELANPAARAEHEAYLREVEERAKNDVGADGGEYTSAAGSISIPKGSKLISPTPIFCVKVVVPADAQRVTPAPKLAQPSGLKKFFINMCICDAMNDINSQKVGGGKADSKKSSGNGLQVSLPYSLSAMRPTKDTAGGDAGAYDFVFSSATWAQYEHVPRYVQMFTDMAVEAVEEREAIKAGTIDKNADVTRLRNAQFKGGKPPPRLFKLSQDKLKEAQKAAAAAGSQKDAEESKTQSSSPAAAAKKSTGGADMKQVSSKTLPKADDADSKPKETRLTPSYQLVHRGFYDISAGQMQLGAGVASDASTLAQLASSRPKQLVVKISLPELTKVSEVNLDQSASQLLLSSARYFLLVPLPFPVLPDAGAAAWSSKTKTLTVTMDVAPPSQEEIDRFEAQRAPLQLAQQEREKQRKQGLEQDKQEEQARIESERKAAEEEKQRKADAATTAAAETAAAAAAAAASSSDSASSSSSLPAGAPTHGRRHSVLKNSSQSPSSGAASASEKHTVRFDLAEQEADDSFVIPERDGPHGPKPVGLLDDSALASELATLHHAHRGKGHKKKHVPGAEGPPQWTGIGVEPDRRVKEAFPPDRLGALSPGSVPASPLLKASASPKLGAAAAPSAAVGGRLWPAFTYSQSDKSIVVVVKVKGIAAESVKWFLEDGPAAPSATEAADAADADAAPVTATSTRLDLYFHTAPTPAGRKQSYRLFLPLSRSVELSKCNFAASPANLVLNLGKKPLPAAATTGASTTPAANAAALEWEYLADWSVLGEQFNPDGSSAVTPAQSPAASPALRKANTHGLPPIEELSLGVTALGASSANSTLVQEVGAADVAAAAASAPATSSPQQPAASLAPLQPLPSLAGSTMFDPFIASAVAAAPATHASAAAPSLLSSVPAASLLFQLD